MRDYRSMRPMSNWQVFYIVLPLFAIAAYLGIIAYLLDMIVQKGA